MGWVMHWLKSSESRGVSLENPHVSLGDTTVLELFGGGNKAATGQLVNERAALGLSAVYNAVQIIAGTIGTLPLKLYRRSDDGGKEEERDHPLYELVHNCPADMLTSAGWREAIQGHVLLQGNGYTFIDRAVPGSRPRALVPLNPRRITREGRTYVYQPSHGQPERLRAEDVIHIPNTGTNGLDGWSVIALARESLGLTMGLEESNARFLSNNSSPSGILTFPNPLSREAKMRVAEQWRAKNTGVKNTGRVALLDDGAQWQQIGLSFEDAQFLQSRQFQVGEIARWFNIPPHMLKDLERATFSNVEHQGIEFVTHTIRPHVVRWEQNLNTKLLTTRERRAGLFFAFTVDGLLRGDVEQRTAAYRSLFEMGAISPNEIRGLEGRNPIPEGNESYVRMDMAPLSRADELIDAKVSPTDPDPQMLSAGPVREKRAGNPQQRLSLRETFREPFEEAAGRMVRGEVRNIRRLLQKNSPNTLAEAITRYYFDDHPEFALATMGPIVRTYANLVADAALGEINTKLEPDVRVFSDEYADTFIRMYSGNSRRDLVEREPDAIEERLTVWADGDVDVQPRHVQVAQRQVVELGEAVAQRVWQAAGILTVTWNLRGDTCPYCRRLAGRSRAINAAFIAAGEAFHGEDTDVPLVPKVAVGHAPAHRGCDCYISAG